MKLSARQRFEEKKLTRAEFERICRPGWVPVRLDQATIPTALGGLPANVLAAFASASVSDPNPLADGNPDRGQVGGIDVYREAEEADGVEINKDWYAIHIDPETPDVFYLLGPKRDHEHWIDEIPARLAFAESASVEESHSIARPDDRFSVGPINTKPDERSPD
jgi:hypothetical protein